MGEYFARTGPYVVDVFKGALTGLMALMRALQAVVSSVVITLGTLWNSLQGDSSATFAEMKR
jgi:hypothetical protein